MAFEFLISPFKNSELESRLIPAKIILVSSWKMVSCFQVAIFNRVDYKLQCHSRPLETLFYHNLSLTSLLDCTSTKVIFFPNFFTVALEFLISPFENSELESWLIPAKIISAGKLKQIHNQMLINDMN